MRCRDGGDRRADQRLVALGAGGEDLATDLGVEPTRMRSTCPEDAGVMAARAAGILPLGFIGTVAGLSDPDGYRAMLRRSRSSASPAPVASTPPRCR